MTGTSIGGRLLVSLVFHSLSRQPEQYEQYEQSKQYEQYEQSKQSEQSEQSEQPEQSKQSKQSEQSEQYEQSEQSEQLTQFRQFFRDNSAFRAASSEPKYLIDALLPFPSVSQPFSVVMVIFISPLISNI